MSRGQMGNVYGTAAQQNEALNNESQSSFKTAQQDVTGYGEDVGQFEANNPYMQGGAVQTAENQGLSDIAAAGGQSAGQALQWAAVRTGQNAGGAIAATEEMNRENQRALAGNEAAATERRAAGDVGYREAGLAGREKVASLQDQLAEQQGQLASGNLKTEEEAAQMPSFMDELGQGLITAGTNFAGGFGRGVGSQWGGAND